MKGYKKKGKREGKKMYVAVREKTSIGSIAGEITGIHLVRPLSSKKINEILSKCHRLETITASLSVQNRLSPKTKEILKEKKIILQKNHNAGRAVGIELEKIKKIADLKKDFLSLRKISQQTGIPKSTIHYLIKKAKRKKIKKGKNVFYTD